MRDLSEGQWHAIALTIFCIWCFGGMAPAFYLMSNGHYWVWVPYLAPVFMVGIIGIVVGIWDLWNS